MSTRYPFIRTLSGLIKAAGGVSLIACLVAGFSSMAVMDTMGMPASRQFVVLIPWALAGMLSLAVLFMLAEFCVVAADIGDNTARLVEAAQRDGPSGVIQTPDEADEPEPGRKCPSCAAPQEPDAVHCDQCGAKVVPVAKDDVCPACGALVSAGAAKCQDCGLRLRDSMRDAGLDKEDRG